MREIEYKVGLSDETFFMAYALDKNAVLEKVGGLVARISGLAEVNLRHLYVNPEYRGELGIGKALHQMMVVWAEKSGFEKITLELIPKNPTDYETTLRFIEKIGYECMFETESGYKFGFILKLKKDASP